MGYVLRRLLREALGSSIKGLQRAVALEIADDANDKTRESWASLEDLALWTAAESPDVVRNALKRLAASGWEFRVPLGKGKDGRTLYAVPGKRLTFRVPLFEGVAPATPTEAEGVAPAPPTDGEGVAPAPSEGAPAPSEGAVAPSEGAPAPPSSSSPQDSSSPHARAERTLRAAGASEDETRKIIENIAARPNVRDVSAYVRTLVDRGDLPGLLTELRADQADAERDQKRASVREQIQNARRDGPECPHGERGGASIHPETGLPLCPVCRNARQKIAS